MCVGVLNGLKPLVGLGLQAVLEASLILGFSGISLIIVVAGVGPLSGQRSAVIVTADADCLPRTLTNPLLVCGSVGLRPRDGMARAQKPAIPIIRHQVPPVKSTLTQAALDAFCQNYHIPNIVHPELPAPNQSIHDSHADVLGYFRINMSQLSVIAAANVSHFEILCRVHGYVPTVGLFCRFYVNFKNKGWMSFSKRSDTALVCYTKPLDLLKHWNDSFFWVDASVFPLSVLWHTNKMVTRDPSPIADEFNAEVSEFLVTHQALFRKFLESFLCLVGISRYYDLDDNVYPTFLTNAREEMDLFAFIHHVDPTKVRIGKRQIEEGQVSLLESTRGRVIPLAGENEQGDQHDNVEDVEARNLDEEGGDAEAGDETEESDRKLKEDHSTSGDAGASTAGKSLVTLQGLLERSTLAAKVGVTAAEIVPFMTCSVTPSPERKGGGHNDSISGPNLRTRDPAERFVISLNFSHHSSTNVADAEVTSTVRSPVPPPPVMTAAIDTTTIVGVTFTPVLVHHSLFRDSASPSLAGANVVGPSQPAGVEVSADTFYVSQDMDMVDHLAPPGFFSQLRGMDYEQLFAEFNVGVACQACFSVEVRLRPEHNYRERKKFKRKCNRQADLLKEKDIDIANLKAQLSLKEAEVTKAIRLRDQVSIIEVAEAIGVDELNSLKERNIALEAEKSTLEGQVAAFECATIIKDTELASVNAQVAKLNHNLSILQLSCICAETTCSGLRDQVSGYELFKEQIEAVLDEQVKVLSDRVAGLDTELMGMALYLDEEFYPRFLTTIAGQRWIINRDFRLVVLKCLQSPEYVVALGTAIGLAIDKGMQTGFAAGIDHGKAERDLIEVVAYDTSVEGKSFAETSKGIQLQPSYEQLFLPIHLSEDNTIIGETSLSDSLDVIHARVRKIKEGDSSLHLSISDAIVPLVGPLSSENLVGETSTSRVPTTVAVTTVLSTTFAHTSPVPPISVSDYKVLDAEP
ncbi:hypothetical protein Tco_1021276 [Tanacetum coccineum]